MSVSLTERAADHIKSFAGEPRLRVDVKADGCTGLSYHPSLITLIQDSDHVYNSHGVTVVISSESIPFLDGTEIDYVTRGLNAGFVYNNPNATGNCGCGESFTTGEQE
jgi:iron-sulfur cluster assembly protein